MQVIKRLIKIQVVEQVIKTLFVFTLVDFLSLVRNTPHNLYKVTLGQFSQSIWEHLFNKKIISGTIFPGIHVHAPVYESKAMVHAPKVSPKCTFLA